jgi:hypothetical protein
MPENASSYITVEASLGSNESIWIYLKADGKLDVSKSAGDKKLYTILSSGNRFWLCEAGQYIRVRHKLMPREEIKISVFDSVPYVEFISSRATESLIPLKNLIRPHSRIRLAKIKL